MNQKDRVERVDKIMKEKKEEIVDNDKQKLEKKDSIVSTIIAIVVVIAIVGIIIFILSRQSEPINENQEIKNGEYNGFYFYKGKLGLWYTTMKTVQGDSEVPFRYHPKELEELRYDPRINERLGMVQRNNGKVVIVFDSALVDPNLTDVGAPTIAGIEIGKITSKVFGMPTETAFTEPIEGAEDLKVFNCLKSATNIFVFEFRLGEEGDTSRIYNENFCAVISAANLNDTIKLADLAAYKLTGIMEK